MPEYSYTVTEYDLEQTWIARGSSRGQVTLPDDSSFFEWAQEHWPAPRWSVELDPWQLTPKWPE